MRSFASALESIPLALAENSGLSPIETLADVQSRQVKENNFRLGVDCNLTGNNGIFFFFFCIYVKYIYIYLFISIYNAFFYLKKKIINFYLNKYI